MNAELVAVLTSHAQWFTERFGSARPEYYLFAYGKPMPSDPTRPITDITGLGRVAQARQRSMPIA